jgi:glycosyltransferase involved in cell wall biosynthesis
MSGCETVLTVLIPCRNVHPSYFSKALESVICQTSPRWRLAIVVDDDDPDTAAVIGSEIDQVCDPRIFLVETEAKRVTGKLNAGMRHARTPYVCVLHADDLLDERAVEVVSRYIAESPEIDYFHSSRLYIDDAGVQISEVRRAVESFTLADFKARGLVKSLHCFRVSSALAIGGMDESLGLHGGDDHDFSWSMAEAGYKFKAIAECLYYVRDHRSHYRLTTHVPLDAQISELVKIMRKHKMTELEIAEQIRRREAGYLRQALYLDEADRREKERDGYDIRRGWRQRY